MRSGSIRSGQLTPGSFDLVIKVIEVQLEILLLRFGTGYHMISLG